MTCKDCVYYKVCYSRISYAMDYDEIGKEITDIQNRCKGFLDKSCFVEVVRCMHCQYFKTSVSKENYCDIHSTIWGKFYVKEKHFCSYGQKLAGG